MEMVLALAIGVLTGSGVWLLLRPRTFQVIMGLALLSYAVNLFIFSMGRLGLAIGKEPVLQPGLPQDLAHYADPMPQALALTAIVIGFAMTALFLVVLLASRGLAGTDHVDGTPADDAGAWPAPYQASSHDALPRSTPAGQGQGTPQPSPSGLASPGGRQP